MVRLGVAGLHANPVEAKQQPPPTTHHTTRSYPSLPNFFFMKSNFSGCDRVSVAQKTGQHP